MSALNSSRKLLEKLSLQITGAPNPGFSTEGFRRKKGIWGPLDSQYPELHDPLKFNGSKVRYLNVELFTDVEFVTHSRTYRFTKGVQSIPLDLAKMLFRLHQARPVIPEKTVLPTKPGRY